MTSIHLWLLLWAFTLSTSYDTPTLPLKILDESGRPVAARIQLFDSAGAAQPITSRSSLTLVHPRTPAMGVVVPASGCEIDVPPSQSRLRVGRGGEYSPVELNITAPSNTAEERTVRLRRWVNMALKGWWSGDMHVHGLPADMHLLMEASDLHFAPTITKWNDRSSLDTWPEQRIYSVSGDRVYSIDNCEDERGWGAALFLGVKSPLRLYPGGTKSHYPPTVGIWREARQKGGFIDLEKPIWWGAPVVVALVPPDSIGVAGNHFMEREVLATEVWGRPRDRERYPGRRGFALHIFDLYYHYLNTGRRIPASAGSANGVLNNPLGYNRSYVYLGSQFSYGDWLAGQKAGRNFVTNGPMLFLKVNGELPGAVIEADDLHVQLEALADGELEKLELIVNGEVRESFTPGADARRFSVSIDIHETAGGWVAARCFEKSPDTVRFAHTSPVYLGRTPARSPAALAFMRAWIDDEMERIRGFRSLSAAERAQLLELCIEAREMYH